MEAEVHGSAEEALRRLAAAVHAVRLYPPTSPLRARAATAFTARANAACSALGSLSYDVDARGFRFRNEPVARTSSQVRQLAERLHALQVGQLIIAPGLRVPETEAFIETILGEPIGVHREGGVRTLMTHAGVEHIAAIEVSLGSSRESGLIELDLLTAPLSDIADRVVSAAQNWATSARLGEGRDLMLEATSQLGSASRDAALIRIAEALMHVDEDTRMEVLAWSLRTDVSGRRMDGMLQVLARMRPAALARLLSIVAAQTLTDPDRIVHAMELPVPLAEEIGALLAPGPMPDVERAACDVLDHVALVEQATAERDHAELDRQIAAAAPSLAAGNAVTAAVAVSRRHPDELTVRAISTVLPRAARTGAFVPVRIALNRLNELAGDPALTESASTARDALSDPKVLIEMCRSVQSEADAAIAAEVLGALGTVGAEALVDAYDRADEGHRTLQRPILRDMSEQVLQVASKRLRGTEALPAVTVVRTLPLLEDQRTVPVLVKALQNVHTEVRLAAVQALADTPGSAARQSLAKLLSHWDPETQRLAVHEIARVGAVETIPPLLRSLQDINVFRLNYELKKEIVRSLAQLGSADALPALRRLSKRPALRRQTKELRLMAQRAVLAIQQHQEEAERGPEPDPNGPTMAATASPLRSQDGTATLVDGATPGRRRPARV